MLIDDHAGSKNNNSLRGGQLSRSQQRGGNAFQPAEENSDSISGHDVVPRLRGTTLILWLFKE